MSFLDQYGITEDQIKEASGYKLAPLGHHRFEIGDAKVQKGTKNRPKDLAFIIEYQLSDFDGNPTGSVRDRFLMKENGVVTDKASTSLGWFERRLRDLGFEGGSADPDFNGPDDLVGLRGTLEVTHQTSGDRVFDNVRNVEVDKRTTEDSSANEYADEPEERPAPKRRKKREPVPSPAAENEDLWSED